MTTLTRRDRVAVGGTQGGALYYSRQRRWPEPAPGVFEKFGTRHPGSIQRAANDLLGHSIQGLTVANLDGTPKIYSGYGGISVNLAPVYIWPLSLDGVWDPTYVLAANGYSVNYFEQLEGKLWGTTGDHSASGADFFTGGPGGVWINGKCAPGATGFQHPFWITRHDGYTWVCGQTYTANHGGVWRGTDPTGVGGEYVLDDFPPGETLCRPLILFSLQGKLWYQAYYYTNTSSAKLLYWDETAHKFLDSGLKLDPQSGYIRRWKGQILSAFGAGIQSFNGTSVTKPFNPQITIDFGPPIVAYRPPNIQELQIADDDTVWTYDEYGVFSYSTDLVHWTKWGQYPTDQFVSFMVYGGCLYVGDNHDQIWRSKVTV